MAVPAFDARESTIHSIHEALSTQRATVLDITKAHLARIETLNPKVNAIISLNRSALTDAAAIDASFARGELSTATHRLLGVPVLLKDNYDAARIPTTGGCLALKNNTPSEDAPLVKALRDAGAILLGKTNLHEQALEGLSVSSLGGQTLNPFDLTRTPGGSSGGSGAAIALSFAVLATGTDTVNSLRNPASANCLVSVRPTRGLLSRVGIIPVSYTQDTAGPIGRTVADVATMLDVMKTAPSDTSDRASTLVPDSMKRESYLDDLEDGRLKGRRIGILRGFFNLGEDSETAPVNAALRDMIAKLEGAGVTVVDIDDEIFDAERILKTMDTQRYEYREQMNGYLQRSILGGKHPETLHALYEDKQFLVIPSQYEYVHTALASRPDGDAYHAVLQRIEDLRFHVRQLFRELGLDAMLYPQQKNLVVKLGAPSQSGRNGILAAVTGFPVVALPAGFSRQSDDAPRGVPIGMELLGLPWSEGHLLRMAWQIEQRVIIRRSPLLGDTCIEGLSLKDVPCIEPENANVPLQYPMGVLEKASHEG